jgi:hypothetical protein
LRYVFMKESPAAGWEGVGCEIVAKGSLCPTREQDIVGSNPARKKYGRKLIIVKC